MLENTLCHVLYYNPLDVVTMSEGRMSMSLQVWVNAEMDSSGRVHFAADSDSELTRGLAAVLVEALSGLTPEEVLQVRCVAPFRHAWHGTQACPGAGLLERAAPDLHQSVAHSSWSSTGQVGHNPNPICRLFYEHGAVA